MKGLVFLPILMALSAAAAVLILRGFGRPVDVRNLVASVVISMLAAEAALVPLLLAARAGPVGTTQAALVGTVLHLFLAVSLGAAAYMMKLAGRRDVFLFYLLCFYWVSLLYVVAVMVKEIRRAATDARSSNSAPLA